MRRAILLLASLILAVIAWTPASAAKRVAFVVGIDHYDNLDSEHQLKKAVNDAHAVGETLKTLGYDVLEADNVTRLDFVRQWQTFLNHIDPGDEAAFFFAGHGVEIGGLNFLLPRDVPQVASGEEQVLKSQGLSLSDFLDQVRERKPQVSLYVVDACRDNPFTDANGRGIGGTRGLARVEPPSGTFVMFSAGAGETALDRLSDNDADPDSVYTRTLLPQLKAPGKSITDIARDVRREVRELASHVQHVQTPAYYDEVVGEFCPAGCEAKVAAAEPSHVTAPTPPPATAPPQVPEASAPVADLKVAIAVPPKPEVPRQSKSGASFKDCDQCPEMVVVPAGEFTMGSPDGEVPQHKVTIPAPFAVGKFEVTKDQFDAFISDSGHDEGSRCWTYETWDEQRGRSFRNPGFKQEGNEPAVCVSWDDAEAYAAWLSEKTGKPYRLLSEAEWEYAARAGSQLPLVSAKSEGDLCDYANAADRTAVKTLNLDKGLGPVDCLDGYAYTSPVGTFAANGFGLHDMLGNASEWVQDCWHKSYFQAPADGSPWETADAARSWNTPDDCSERVVRGGSWLAGNGMSVSEREPHKLGSRDSRVGLRVARALTP